MEKLLAMILTAYDPRRNPAAGLFWSAASRALDSVAGLAGALFDDNPSASISSQTSGRPREGSFKKIPAIVRLASGKYEIVYVESAESI